MKYNILEKNSNSTYKNEFVIDDKIKLKSFKKSICKGDKISIVLDESVINLTQKLYGTNKKETILIQKQNCKKIINLYRFCKKLIKFLNHKKFDFGNTFYITNLKEKQNNNDFMLSAMLETYFCYNPFQRIGKSNEFACDFIDKENEIHNMCDFKDDRCINYRENNIERSTGCCPSACKYTKNMICDKKCLSCKIFMCDFMENRGYYFTPNTIPILKVHLTLFERFVSTGHFFKPLKKTSKFLWLARAIEFFYVLAFVLILLLIFSVI